VDGALVILDPITAGLQVQAHGQMASGKIASLSNHLWLVSMDPNQQLKCRDLVEPDVATSIPDT
jgi:hypothetical protein